MENNTVVFIPDTSEIGNIFEKHMDAVCDYPYQRDRSSGLFYFPVPPSMDIDELTDLLEACLKHQDDIKGDWSSVICESPEDILSDFPNFSADMDQYGVYFIPGQISRHEEYNDLEGENELQSAQVSREENMTLRILHDIPDCIRLLRETLQEDISETHKHNIEKLLLSMNLNVEAE
jgi:hypothetical protein